MNRIRVAYASDENYAALTAISAVSVLRHNPNAEIILLRQTYREAAGVAQLPDAAEQTKALPLQYKMQYWMWKLLPGCVFNLLYPYLLNRHIRKFYKIA